MSLPQMSTLGVESGIRNPPARAFCAWATGMSLPRMIPLKSHTPARRFSMAGRAASHSSMCSGVESIDINSSAG